MVLKGHGQSYSTNVIFSLLIITVLGHKSPQIECTTANAKPQFNT
jgi:hypothetical protein